MSEQLKRDIYELEGALATKETEFDAINRENDLLRRRLLAYEKEYSH